MEAILDVRGVSVEFGGLHALEGLTFTVQSNEIVGVIGPNGAGKSTLFGVICGDIRPNSGEVLFKEQPLGTKRSDAIARMGIVRTFQTPRPFTSMTFLENVTLGALTRTNRIGLARSRGADALARVGLLHCANSPSAGASTGQRKRLDIARVLAAEPSIVLLDEPLGGVDPGSIAELIELLQRIHKEGIALVVIEHNIQAICQLAGRLVAMTLGKKITEGPPNEVIQDHRLIQAYLGDAD
jgi:branched-chain amino acid transport system ATP-binding protein